MYERVYATNLVHDFPHRYIFAGQKFDLQSHDFEEGGKRNYRARHSVNDASGMRNGGCYAHRSASSFFLILSQFSSPTMSLADKVTSVGCTFGFHRE